jgi:hypothetical protein
MLKKAAFLPAQPWHAARLSSPKSKTCFVPDTAKANYCFYGVVGVILSARVQRGLS